MQQLIEIKNKLDSYRNYVGQLQGQYFLLSEQNKKDINKVEWLKTQALTHAKAIELLQLVQTVTRDYIKNQFESLVTFILNFVTQEDYKFVLEFDRRGNLSELDFKVQPPDEEESFNPLESAGGGINNLVSFGLRTVLAEISKTKGFMIYDEPFSALSENYRPRANLLQDELQKKLKKQVILISHDPLLKDSNYNLITIGE